jgi:putative peptidoglycan lipid II flippase
LLQHGRFTVHDVQMASMSLAALAIGLPAFALVKVLAPAFYARQDTVTPVRAGIAAMVASMLMNVVFVGLLFWLWHAPSDLEVGWMAAIARVPGLHVGLAFASALASYLNVALLWRALRREGVYLRQPGWGRHLLRLAWACATMVAVLGLGLWHWREWSNWEAVTRIWRLAVLVAAGGGSFLLALFAAGFRLRDLRA